MLCAIGIIIGIILTIVEKDVTFLVFAIVMGVIAAIDHEKGGE